MKRAPRSRQRHDLYAKYHDYDSEISDLLGECGVETFEFAVAEPKKVEVTAEYASVAIPENWEELHWASQVKLAKEILGDDLPEVEGKKAAEVAADVIRAELNRRAAGNSENPAE